MHARAPCLAALTGIVALVGTLCSSFATEGGPGTYGLHPVKRSFPGRLLGFQENGEVIVTANDNGLQYWDVTSGNLRESRDLEVGWSVLSPDGSTLAGLSDWRCVPEGGDECPWIISTVRLVDVASGQIVETDLTGPVRLAFSPDGATLALRTLDGISLLDVATGGVRDVLADSTEEIEGRGVAFSPDGSLLATTFWNGEEGLRIWDLAAGQLQSTISTQRAPWYWAFSPDGETLATADGLWGVASGQRLSTFDLGSGTHEVLAFSPDGATLATVGGFEVALWDKDGRWKTLLLSDIHGGMGVAYSPDGSLLASTVPVIVRPWGEEVLVWDLTALPPNRPARGEVVLVDSLGSPIADTELRVGQNDFRYWLTRTDSEGRAPLAVYRQGPHEVLARGGRGWRSIPLLPDRPFTLTLEASGGVDRGDYMGYVFGRTHHDLLRPWHLEGFPVHRIEVEAQVLGLPERESYDRYFLRLERSISGKSDPSTWISEIDSTGHVRLPIATTSRPSGLYQARIGSNSWQSLPLNQGRRYRLELPIGGPARVMSLGAMKTAIPVSSESSLGPNVPNPFNQTTQIPYRLVEPGRVRLVIYNAIGQPVRTLVDGFREAGSYEVVWNAGDIASGVYWARLAGPRSAATRRLLLLK